MQIKIIAPDHLESERLEQILNYYHSKLEDQVQAMTINLTHLDDNASQIRYSLEITAKLKHADMIELQEVQPDFLAVANRVFNRLLRITQGQPNNQRLYGFH
jgi:3-hydroxyacyl-CoA dehydrogenase